MNNRILPVMYGLVAAAMTLSTGCERKDPNNGTADSSRSAPAADNTARNERDQNLDTKTPMDQRENSADIKITAEIRRAIMDTDGMSIKGQNIKVITENGVVTLRGPVDTQAEKDSIEAMAKAVAGVTRVDNQLEVKTS